MTFVELGGLLLAVTFGLGLVGVYVLYRMVREGADGLRRTVALLHDDRRGDSR